MLSLQGSLRLKILDTYYAARAGHIGSSLSCIDILIATMINRMRRGDRFILSKGHAAVALYAVLNQKGLLSDEELSRFYCDGTRYPAHIPAQASEHIPFGTGSLGHGFSLANGIALGHELAGDRDAKVFCLMSDGECNEGSVWEAAQFAVKHRLSNLVVLIDKNNLQGFARTNEIADNPVSRAQWESFGFRVLEADGHSLASLNENFEKIDATSEQKPSVIICDTIKGKGVSFMEDKLEWHYLPMNDEQYKQACREVSEKYHA